MHRRYGQSIAARLKWRENVMTAEESASVKGCGNFLRPFAPCAPFRLCDRGRRALFHLLEEHEALKLKSGLSQLWKAPEISAPDPVGYGIQLRSEVPLLWTAAYWRAGRSYLGMNKGSTPLTGAWRWAEPDPVK